MRFSIAFKYNSHFIVRFVTPMLRYLAFSFLLLATKAADADLRQMSDAICNIPDIGMSTSQCDYIAAYTNRLCNSQPDTETIDVREQEILQVFLIKCHTGFFRDAARDMENRKDSGDTDLQKFSVSDAEKFLHSKTYTEGLAAVFSETLSATFLRRANLICNDDYHCMLPYINKFKSCRKQYYESSDKSSISSIRKISNILYGCTFTD